ncbi:MAG: hypothetical protein U0Y10_19550 [Spirosomataceae bacterium]
MKPFYLKRYVYLFAPLQSNSNWTVLLWWGMSLVSPSFAQTIALSNQPIPFAPKKFYIEEVTDERPNPNTLGSIIVNGKTSPATLVNGVRRELMRYLTTNLTRNTSLQPVVVRIKTFSLNEALSGNRVSGKCELELEFAVRKNNTLESLTTFQTGVNFTHPPREYDLYESFIRKMLANALQHFDTWMSTNGQQSPSLAKRVHVTFKDYIRDDPATDTVFYSPIRPLIWKDFLRQVPPMTRYGAAVYTSIAYEAKATVVNQQIELEISMKVFMLKSNSWVQPSAKDPYSLRHEQLHFDITKLVAERFKQKILEEELPPDDYDSRLQYIYLDSFREMNRLQEQYDAETQHSIVRSEQNKWDNKITNELKSLLEK